MTRYWIFDVGAGLWAIAGHRLRNETSEVLQTSEVCFGRAARWQSTARLIQRRFWANKEFARGIVHLRAGQGWASFGYGDLKVEVRRTMFDGINQNCKFSAVKWADSSCLVRRTAAQI